MQIESINKRFSGQCQLCDFVTTKMFRADAEDDLAEHLRDFHRVPPTIVQAAPFVPVAKASEKAGDRSDSYFNSGTTTLNDKRRENTR